jgi:hypothetical protein
MLSVVFMLWTDPRRRNKHYSYTGDHVRRAINMVGRHLSLPHRFILVTDGEGVDGSERVPIDLSLLKLGASWPKLMLFQPSAPQLFGQQVLCMDLDLVVVDQLDPLITDDDFKVMRPTGRGMYYNGSMVLLKTGTRNQVWDQFDPKRAPILVGENPIGASDQWWYYKCLGPREKTFTTKVGVYQYLDVNQADSLPSNARVVFFPGPYDPCMPEIRSKHKWIKENWR